MKNFRSVGKVTDAASRVRFSGKLRVAALSGLLIGSFVAVGCSKTDSQSSETQPSANQMTLNQPAMPTPVNTAAATTAPSAPKKVVKKRPTTVKYSDQTYGVSFLYPRQYSLKSGADIDSASGLTDFVQPGGVTAVSVEVPKDSYPGTDFAAAFFRVNINKSLTEAECGQFGPSQPLLPGQDAVQPAHLALGGLEMEEIETISGEETNQADTKYYHLFQNGACYEFALGLSTEGTGDDETISPVNREKVFQRLGTILASVKVKPQTAPELAAGSATAPAAQGSVVK